MSRFHLGIFQFLLDKDLLAEGGTICVDNTLWNGNSYLVREERDETMVDPHSIPEFNQLVADDERVYQVHHHARVVHSARFWPCYFVSMTQFPLAQSGFTAGRRGIKKIASVQSKTKIK